MLVTLKEYQAEAVTDVLRSLRDAKDDYRSRSRKVAFSLSATTGAGKTVMATAVFETLLAGEEDSEFDADPTAVVLWVTDDPSLNEQTRFRITGCSDKLDTNELIVIDSTFQAETFDTGTVYFLNVQKLGSSSNLVKRNDLRTYTLWDTIKNTIADPDRTLYLVLDEAHRGMRSPSKNGNGDSRSTIVRRLVNGHNDVPAAPIVWGISATVQRFEDAMRDAHVHGRTTYPPVWVEPAVVQESGLLKDTIMLDFPAESGAFVTAFLRAAVCDIMDMTERWATYAEAERLPNPVLPLLVIQVPNAEKGKEPDLLPILEILYNEWPGLAADGVAHVFGDHADLTVGRFTVPYIQPQDVQDATYIRVLMAKDAVSTGWDCPRAEVLYSMRHARDRTHITQLLGRMVRTPLARRVASDERLNSVTCFLPFFDQPTATSVAKILTGEAIDDIDPDTGPGGSTGRKVLMSSVIMEWNAAVPQELKDCLVGLPSVRPPKVGPKPVKRLLALAAAIGLDGLMPDANKKAHAAMFSLLDGQLAQHADTVAKGVEDIYTAEVRRITSSLKDKGLVESTRTEVADDRTVDEAFKGALRALGSSVANGYAKKLAINGQDDDAFDIHAARARLAALTEVDGVRERVDGEAEKLANTWLRTLRVKWKVLPEERRAVYEEIKQQARDPQPIDLIPPKSRIENTKDEKGSWLPTRTKHLLSDLEGQFPVASLNDWELAVVDTELARDETVGWYRNPSSATANDALQIPYQINGAWRSMQPDFIFFTSAPDGAVAASIVDPHGDHLADALPKLLGLADFAERHGLAFLRIEAVSKVDKELRMLDMADPQVRAAIRQASSAKEVYRGPVAVPYG